MIPFACTPAALVPSFPFGPGAGAGTILIVEDEAFVCELAAEALLDEGYRVLTAADADEAEAILSSEQVDLLFTDIDLARNTNGIALAHRARRSLPRLPVVYTSGGRDGLSPTEAVSRSVFVPKPYRTAQIVAVTHDLLRDRG